MHFVFFFLCINQTICFAFLWASLLSSARNAQVSTTLWVIAMVLIAWTTWDNGRFLNGDDISEGAKTLITLVPCAPSFQS